MGNKIDILQTKTVLFHHHELIYVDENGRLWLSSGIGLWLDELAIYFDTVYLFMYTCSNKQPTQDMFLYSENFHLINIGNPGNYTDFLSKRIRINSLCVRWSGFCDYFIIRGFTPMQVYVWNRIEVRERKIYYLVRSLFQKRPFKLFDISFIAYLANRIKEFQFQKILNSDCIMIANSELISRELSCHTKNPVFFAPSNVISKRSVPKYQFNQIKKELNFLFVGRISIMKGIIELLEAMVLFKHKNGANFKMHLVGDGDKPFIDRCTEFINKNDILDNIIFHGRKSFNEDLFRLYKNADVFILPSHTEGFPRVVWEAALFTCPIIVTSVGGIPFVLKNNWDAIFIPPLNSEAISIALQKIIENYNEYKIMTTNAYNLALQNTLENGIKLFVNNIIMEVDNLS